MTQCLLKGENQTILSPKVTPFQEEITMYSVVSKPLQRQGLKKCTLPSPLTKEGRPILQRWLDPG